MGFLDRKDGDENKIGRVKSPGFDPYGRFKNTGTGLFGFRADNHVVIPGVTSYEERSLEKVKDYVEKKTGKPCTLSQELINDVYSIYVNDEVKRRPHDNNNNIRHQVLDKVYDSLTKVVTVDSSLYTQILTRELAMVLQQVDDEIRDEQKKQGDGDGEGEGEGQGLETSVGEGEGEGDGEGKGQGEGEGNEGGTPEGNDPAKGAGKGTGGGTRQSIEDIAQKALDKADKKIEAAKVNADAKIKDLEEQLGKEALKDLMDQEPEFLEKIEELKDRLSKVSINKDSIRKVLEKILNESMNYFSKKFKVIEESLFETDDFDDLFGLELLHPVFRNAEIMNVGNESKLYKGKIDLYLDCSGSMSSNETFEGVSIRMSDLAKGIAMVLYRMGMIENLYFFNGGLIPIDNPNELSILAFSKTGGTDFNNVVENIKRTGNNSVIITDGYDRCSDYSKQAFWVGIGGTTFSSDDDAFEMYRDSKQCVAYNSDTSKFDYC